MTPRLIRHRGGQSVAEYAILIGVVSAAIIGMSTYAKRGMQGMIKKAADDMSVNHRSKSATLADPTGEKAQLAGMEAEAGVKSDPTVAGAVRKRDSSAETSSSSETKLTQSAGGALSRQLNDKTSTKGTSTAETLTSTGRTGK